MTLVDTVVKNGQLVTPSGIIKASLAIDNSIITGVGSDEHLPKGDRVIDADGKYVFPGIIDPHTHPGAQRPFPEDVKDITRLAAYSGITTVIGVCKSTRIGRSFKELSDPEDAVSYLEIFPEAKRIIEENACVDFAFSWAIQSDQHAEQVPLYAEKCGVTSFKFYIGYKKADPYTRHIGLPTDIDDGTIYLGFEKIGQIGYPGLAMIHAENMEVNRIFVKRTLNSGRGDLRDWNARSPSFSESQHIRAYSGLAEAAGCTLYVVHVSTDEGLMEVGESRRRGLKVYAETCPQYLMIHDKEDPPGIYGKVNPPIRSKEHNEALWQGVNRGMIDCIGTDHVPTTMHLKEIRRFKTMGSIHMPKVAEAQNLNIWNVGGAFTGSHTMFPAVLDGAVKRGVPLETLVKICSENTARVFGFYPKKGVLSVGSDADLTIVDLSVTKKVSEELFPDTYSVFEGRELKGWPQTTLLRGQTVLERGEFVGKPGKGVYLHRRPSNGSRQD